MSDPKRLFDESADSFERQLLDSAQADAPSDRAFTRAMGVFGGAAGALTTGSAGAASTGAAVKVGFGALVLKWGGVGALCAAATAATTGVVLRALPRDIATSAEARLVPPLAPPAVTAGSVPSEAPAMAEIASASPPEPVIAEVRSLLSGPPSPPIAASASSDLWLGTAPASAAPARASGRQDGIQGRPHSRLPIAQSENGTGSARGGGDQLSRELALLDGARSALYHGQSAKALSLLDRREREVGAGALAPEATVLRVHALMRRGDRAGAERVALAFLTTAPRGPHADRLRALLTDEIP